MPIERLLVIDDSLETCEFLEDFLGSQGYTVLTACDGEEGLLRALNENPDVILLDMQMPKMTGLEVIEALHQQGNDTPAILLTARGSEGLVVRAFRLGARDYVPKPYEPHIVLEAVERALRQVRQRKERDRLTDQLTQANQTLQQQLQELNALYGIGKSVTSLLDVDKVLARAVEAAASITRAEQCLLMLLNEPGGGLCLRAAKDANENQVRILSARVQDNLAADVVHTGRSVILSGERLKQATTAYTVNALLMVPLHTQNRGGIGVLLVANRISERTFGEHDLHLLSAVASYAAIAIDNALSAASLQAEKKWLKKIVHEVTDGILIVDGQGRVLMCNQAARGALNLGQSNVLGRPVHNVITNQALLDLLGGATESHSLVPSTVPLADGRTLNANISAINDVGYAIVLQDVSHLK